MRVPVAARIHKVIPSRNGLMPTLFRVAGVRLAPMQNKVSTKVRLATASTQCPGVRAAGIHVTIAAAIKKPKINQGRLALPAAPFSPRAKRKPQAYVTGTIHSARANFTVVPICRASFPYCKVAPTTELVS